ncbi:rifin PIR protein, putative [Plasmodium reichenowi]|uniref:Rifin PIR protein, putative n=1 Tax=Plasmodium reichenowi TaxID=5854 RepID=A0A2P9DSL6_PLARE|nr:rifin PIR protein, putative [Plasmodium reichenowi]
MELNYTKILLFFFPLNILLILLSNAHNKNKPCITTHHTQTNRSLCECDIQSTFYDKDADMKSVKEIFDRQTSQRFEEYQERMKDKRQKRKEERNKNIQKIIEKDKSEKSLAEKVEIGCLRCGCGLGSVAASVGMFGTVAVKELTKTATAAAVAAAEKEAIAEATQAGMNAVVAKLKGLINIYRSNQGYFDISQIVTESSYNSPTTLYQNAVKLFGETCKIKAPEKGTEFCKYMVGYSDARMYNIYAGYGVAEYDAVFASQKPLLEAAKVGAVDAKYATCQTAIIASVVALLIIVLIMVIIYLILRYRRKKKMKKKAQYTKLLNE